MVLQSNSVSKVNPVKRKYCNVRADPIVALNLKTFSLLQTIIQQLTTNS